MRGRRILAILKQIVLIISGLIVLVLIALAVLYIILNRGVIR